MLQLHLNFRLNTWLQRIGQRQSQDETGNIWIWCPLYLGFDGTFRNKSWSTYKDSFCLCHISVSCGLVQIFYNTAKFVMKCSVYLGFLQFVSTGISDSYQANMNAEFSQRYCSPLSNAMETCFNKTCGNSIVRSRCLWLLPALKLPVSHNIVPFADSRWLKDLRQRHFALGLHARKPRHNSAIIRMMMNYSSYEGWVR